MSRINKLRLIREFLTSQANHWSLFSVFIFLANIFQHPYPTVAEYICWVLLSFMPWVLYFTRSFCKHFFPQLFSYLIFAFLVFIIPFESGKLHFACFLLTTCYACISLYRSFQSVEHTALVLPPYITCAITCILLIILSIETEDYSTFPFCVGIIPVCCFYLLRYYVHNFLLFTISNEETSSNMPVDDMFKSGFQVTLAYLTIGTGMMLFIALSTVSTNFFKSIGQFLHQCFVRFIRRIFPENSEAKQTAFSDQTGNLIPQFKEGSGESWIVWDILSNIIIILTILAILGYILYTFYRIIMFLLKLRLHLADSEDTSESYYTETHEKLSKTQLKKSNFKHAKKDIKHRIRSIFKHSIMKSELEPHKRKLITAREYVNMNQNYELANLYEKARYSPEECTLEDLKQMQSAYRRKNK